MSVDDINLKKGNASTACTVIIDGETHRFLAIGEGASVEVAEKLIQEFPSVKIISRDRGGAYKSAATKQSKNQIADKFHLVQNIHQAINTALSQEIGQDLFIQQGRGWVPIEISNQENPVLLASCKEEEEDIFHTDPATLTEDDLQQRIRLAGLSLPQTNKYKHTLEILKLTQKGLRTSEIAKRLDMKSTLVSTYRKEASETIEKVEAKLDDYEQMLQKGQKTFFHKTVSANARHSSTSIVEPYKDTVLKMHQENCSHRTIHKAITKEGFIGNRATVYQYLIRYCRENNLAYGSNSRILLNDEPDKTPSRPLRISLKRVSKTVLYQCLLREAAKEREKWEELNSPEPKDDSHKSSKENKSEEKDVKTQTYYESDVAKIVFHKKTNKTKPKKKPLIQKAFKELIKKYTTIAHLLAFLISFLEVLYYKEITKLDHFIKTYKNNSIEQISIFVSGLQQDYEAICNHLQHSDISNGPIEGTNNKIKLLRKRGYGRTGIELLNAMAALPWYYKDLDENNRKQGNSVA